MNEVQVMPVVQRVRFGAFEVDLRSGELRKHGIRVKLQEKPFQILALLLEQPGELVSREELQRRLWPVDTFVDFDRNLNTAANRLRQALGDSAENPRFVETIPRRGYRLIVPVEKANGHSHSAAEAAQSAATVGSEAAAPPQARASLARRFAVATLIVLVSAAAAYAVWSAFRPPSIVRAGKTMLMVLPFENLSGDAQQEYISDGLTDEMISQIGRMNPDRLRVIARTSAMHYKGTRKSVGDIGRELGVDYVLEGSVRRSNGRLRITAQLVQVRDQTPLWSDTYERGEADLLSIQRDVATHVAIALSVELLPATGRDAGLTKGRTIDPEAYEAYLLGRYYWNQRSVEGLYRGLEYFQRAAEKDPSYAAAYTGIADSYLVLAAQYYLAPQDGLPKAKSAVERALELDPTLSEAHVSRAGIYFLYDWDWAAAEKEFKRSIELNRGSAQAHQWYAGFLSAMGRHEEAIREIETARGLDPLSPTIHTTAGTVRYQARQFDEALVPCQRALELNADFVPARICLSMIYVQKKMFREGVLERQKAMGPEGIAKEDAEAFWRAYATGGLPAAQRWLIDYRSNRIEKKSGLPLVNAKQYVPGYYMAVLYGALGERDKAFDWLERSYQQRDSFLTRIKVDPNLDALRSDPRFQSFLDRLKLNN